MRMLWNDLRHGMRLVREPAFSGFVIAALALGIGANTAIFSLVNGILLRPLSYSHPEQLYLIREIVPQMGKMSGSWPANLRTLDMWQRENHSFEQIAAVEPYPMDFTSTGSPRQIEGVRASANLFTVLGATAQIGRTFLPEENEPGRDRVVVLTNAFWRDEFHGDPRIIGRSITLNGAPYEIIGVLPKSFHFPKGDELGDRVQLASHTDLFKPLGLNPADFFYLGNFRYAAIGRLKNGISPERAIADLDIVQAHASEEASKSMGRKPLLRVEMIPLQSEIIGSSRRGLLLLLGAVGALLLVVCVNLSGLTLARASRRIRDAAIRTALGATGGRLTRQILSEFLPLAIIGGGLGTGLSYLGLLWLRRNAVFDLPRLDEVRVDPYVLLFALGLSVLSSVLFSMLPAWRCVHADPQQLMKSAGTTTTIDRSGLLLRDGLIGIEIGLTTLLLIVAGTLGTSLLRVLNVHKGFQVNGILTVDVALPPQKYMQTADRLRFYEDVRSAVHQAAGVTDAGWISKLPLEGQATTLVVNIPGSVQHDYENLMANYRYVSPEYFQSIGMHLVQGRFFEDGDIGKNVAIVSETLTKRVWPGENPIGKQFHPGPDNAPLVEVVGVAGDVRTISLDKPPTSVVYLPYGGTQMPPTASLVVRTNAANPAVFAPAVQYQIRKVDETVPILNVRSMADIITSSTAQRRFQVLLAYSFALAAFFLAALGIFSVVSYAIEQRRSELGIRVALGAAPATVRQLVLRQGMRPVVTGIAAGIIAGFVVGRLLSGFFFGVRGGDPLVFAAVSATVFSLGIVACYIPALRASAVDPLVSLRSE